MINKGTKIYKKSVTRILEIDQNAKQVNFLDTRFYKKGEKYYPSVTSVLQYFPKNKFFENWLKDVGHNSDVIVRKAADEGTQVHEAIENYRFGKISSNLMIFGNKLNLPLSKVKSTYSQMKPKLQVLVIWF